MGACRDSGQSLFLGIRPRGLDLAHIGNIKLGPIDMRHGLGEVGFMIGAASAWGLGVASAAIAALSDIARDELALRKLTAGCYSSKIGT